jgi:hypothetical protein
MKIQRDCGELPAFAISMFFCNVFLIFGITKAAFVVSRFAGTSDVQGNS